MNAIIELVNDSGTRTLPLKRQFRQWVTAALVGASHPQRRPRLGIRIVDEAQAAALNGQYRQKDYATNVLSFPVPAGFAAGAHLGDLALCASVVASEAAAQGKAPADHWAHLVVHGVLHLLGYDHEVTPDARVMEALEVRILAGLGIGDPYHS